MACRTTASADEVDELAAVADTFRIRPASIELVVTEEACAVALTRFRTLTTAVASDDPETTARAILLRLAIAEATEAARAETLKVARADSVAAEADTVAAVARRRARRPEDAEAVEDAVRVPWRLRRASAEAVAELVAVAVT